MRLTAVRNALLDWRIGSVMLLVMAYAVYGPALDRVFAADQLTYFAEVGGEQSLAAGLRHVDYALSRVYWKGDDLLFRPVLFIWLAIANRLFTYHHWWWNVANVAIHWAVAVAILRLLLAIRPSLLALPTAVLFLVLKPPMELVLWNHLGGYLLACLFLAIGLRSFVRLLDGQLSRDTYVGYAAALTLAALSYEAMVPIAAAGAAILHVRQPTRPSWRRLIAVLVPVIVFSALYAAHALRAPRLGYVDRADGQALFEAANAGSVLIGAGRVLTVWTLELALPAALQLTSVPYERFGKSFAFSWSDPLQMANLAVVVLGVVATGFSTSSERLRRVSPLAVLLLTGLLTYAALIAFGRSSDEVSAITYYAYLPAVLLMPLVYALVDFDRLSGRRTAVLMAVLVAFAFIHATGTIRTAREVGRTNRYQSLYVTRVISFVDAHRSEPDFSFRIEPHPESLDPTVVLIAGYPNDPAATRDERRMTEILFAPYYDDRNPKYVLSASAERIVRQRPDAGR